MNRTPLSPRRILTALVIACTVAGLAPAVASADPAPVPVAQQGHKKHKVKLEASAEKAKVKAMVFNPEVTVRSRGVISQSQSSKRSLWPKRFPAPWS